MMVECNIQVQQLMKMQLETFPFHNLGQLLGKQRGNGGTCFDHALKLQAELKRLGFEARLHEAEVCLTGDKTHRLVRVKLNNKVYFIDTGTGWPTLYQATVCKETREYNVAGIHFRIINEAGSLLIQRFDKGHWRNMNRIITAPQNEESILAKFENRYRQRLPFSNELRFCWMHNNKFYRIAGFNLSVYEVGKPCQEYQCNSSELLNCVYMYFPELTADLNAYFEKIE